MYDKKSCSLTLNKVASQSLHTAEMDAENKRQSNHVSVSFYPVKLLRLTNVQLSLQIEELNTDSLIPADM